MQPFAFQPQKRSRTPWIVAAVFAVGFTVWCFDIVPKIRAVATGKLSGDLAEDLSETDDPAGWDDIVDRSEREGDGAGETRDHDALLSAITSVSEPLDLAAANSEGGAAREIERDRDFVSGAAVEPASLRTGDATDSGSGVRPASFEITSRQPAEALPPVAIPPALAEILRAVDADFRDERILEAHEALSKIYWSHPHYRVHIRSRIEHTARLIYTSPDLQVISPYQVQYGDTLDSIAKQYNIPWPYLARLNRISAEQLQAGQPIKVLTGPFSAVVDLKDFALTVHAHGWFVQRYPIGIGRDKRTPTGEFKVQSKLENPVWYNPEGGQVDADDPTNPLGEYWLGLGDHIGIHGTTDPESVGRAVSRGCIHMADRDIEEVFYFLGIGSRVLIRE